MIGVTYLQRALLDHVLLATNREFPGTAHLVRIRIKRNVLHHRRHKGWPCNRPATLYFTSAQVKRIMRRAMINSI